MFFVSGKKNLIINQIQLVVVILWDEIGRGRKEKSQFEHKKQQTKTKTNNKYIIIIIIIEREWKKNFFRLREGERKSYYVVNGFVIENNDDGTLFFLF